jgi:uncharacterized protein YoxC
MILTIIAIVWLLLTIPIVKKVEKELKRIEEKIAGVEREIEEQTVAIGQLDFSKGETHIDLLSDFELKKTELSILMSEWEEKMGKL